MGAPEIAVTLLVGYFVLGPSDLYKLVKEVGKFIQNFRTLGAEAAKSFEGTMENQLELGEIRKAQAELNEAFSFRRSINTYEDSDAFDKNSFVENSAAATATSAAASATTATEEEGDVVVEGEGAPPAKKKRRLVRRKKKKAVEEVDVPSEEDFLKEYPDLDMLDAEFPETPTAAGYASEEDKLRAERLERLGGGGGDASAEAAAAVGGGEPDWLTASEEDVASAVLDRPAADDERDPAMESYEKQRFQSQMSAEGWNAQIMANEDDLAPLAMVMKRLAILEEEKNAADKRLEEEYERRMNNEDKYYLEKRRVLEEAITDIQEAAYGGGGPSEKEGEGAENNATEFSL